VELKLWHGINQVLLLSVFTVLGGVVVYGLRHRLRVWSAWLTPISRCGPQRCYELGLRTLIATANVQTRLLQHGYLRGYVLTVLSFAMILTGYGLIRFGAVPWWVGFDDVRPHEIAIGLLILAAALVVARTRSRLAAVAAMGVVGYSVALTYALYGAPDLAVTQIIVETLTLVLFVLVVVHLPAFSELSSTRRRRVDAVFAAAAGVVITLLVLKALHMDADERVTEYYAANALRAQGRNVVNVILVDFRALDTLGEITVLAVAALGVFALLKLRPEKRKGDG
jgi:multicomponent Na+:H+ antiporter subunit A